MVLASWVMIWFCFRRRPSTHWWSYYYQFGLGTLYVCRLGFFQFNRRRHIRIVISLPFPPYLISKIQPLRELMPCYMPFPEGGHPRIIQSASVHTISIQVQCPAIFYWTISISPFCFCSSFSNAYRHDPTSISSLSKGSRRVRVALLDVPNVILLYLIIFSGSFGRRKVLGPELVNQ